MKDIRIKYTVHAYVFAPIRNTNGSTEVAILQKEEINKKKQLLRFLLFVITTVLFYNKVAFNVFVDWVIRTLTIIKYAYLSIRFFCHF